MPVQRAVCTSCVTAARSFRLGKLVIPAKVVGGTEAEVQTEGSSDGTHRVGLCPLGQLVLNLLSTTRVENSVCLLL